MKWNAKLFCFFAGIFNGYEHERYWKYHASLSDAGTNVVLKFIRIVYLRRCDNRNGAWIEHRLPGGAHFESPPFLPHGIRGIFITKKASFGKNVTIFQQVTVGLKNLNDSCGPQIGDNCSIGAGAKIIGNIKIGDNCKIGPNCVVWFDVAPNSTVVLDDPKIIIKQRDKH